MHTIEGDRVATAGTWGLPLSKKKKNGTSESVSAQWHRQVLKDGRKNKNKIVPVNVVPASTSSDIEKKAKSPIVISNESL